MRSKAKHSLKPGWIGERLHCSLTRQRLTQNWGKTGRDANGDLPLPQEDPLPPPYPGRRIIPRETFSGKQTSAPWEHPPAPLSSQRQRPALPPGPLQAARGSTGPNVPSARGAAQPIQPSATEKPRGNEACGERTASRAEPSRTPALVPRIRIRKNISIYASIYRRAA